MLLRGRDGRRERPTCSGIGTCAGAILLAKNVENPPQESLGVLDVAIRRNAYGRQVDSTIGSTAAPAGIGTGVGIVTRRLAGRGTAAGSQAEATSARLRSSVALWKLISGLKPCHVRA